MQMAEEDHDRNLLSRVVSGDRAAFDVLIAIHAGAMRSLARAIARDDALADDVTQEALIAAYRGAATYRASAGTLRGWLLAITRNAARRATRCRREEPRAEVEDDLLQLGIHAGWGHSDPELRLGDAEEIERIVQATGSLSLEDREVLLLRDFEGLSGEEAANALGLAVPAMKTRLHRARLRLLAALRQSEGGFMAQDRLVGTLRCSEVLARLSEYVDGELALEEGAEIEAHLRGCTVCERFGGRFAHTVRSARMSLGAAPAVDDEFVSRLSAALGR